MRSSARRRLIPIGAAGVLGILLSGCSAFGSYCAERALDLSDTIDGRIGFGPGLGAKITATDEISVGLGIGTRQSTESFGRQVATMPPVCLDLLVVGGDGEFEGASSFYVLGVRVRHGDAEPVLPTIDRCRFGVELWLLADVGLYVNCGEIADFLAGFFGLDLAGDDSLAKWSRLGRDDRDLEVRGLIRHRTPPDAPVETPPSPREP